MTRIMAFFGIKSFHDITIKAENVLSKAQDDCKEITESLVPQEVEKQLAEKVSVEFGNHKDGLKREIENELLQSHLEKIIKETRTSWMMNEQLKSHEQKLNDLYGMIAGANGSASSDDIGEIVQAVPENSEPESDGDEAKYAELNSKDPLTDTGKNGR